MDPQASGTCNLVHRPEIAVRCHNKSRVEPSSYVVNVCLPSVRQARYLPKVTRRDESDIDVQIDSKGFLGSTIFCSRVTVFFYQRRYKLRYVDFWQRT